MFKIGSLDYVYIASIIYNLNEKLNINYLLTFPKENISI